MGHMVHEAGHMRLGVRLFVGGQGNECRMVCMGLLLLARAFALSFCFEQLGCGVLER